MTLLPLMVMNLPAVLSIVMSTRIRIVSRNKLIILIEMIIK